MAMTIVPGYDFSVNEVPTNSKLTSMLGNISLTGIDLTQIDGSLVMIRLETDTSMPAAGWLRTDTLGNLKGAQIGGTGSPLNVYRGNWGGWETQRYRIGEQHDTFISASGIGPIARGIMDTVPTNDTNESNIYLRPRAGGGNDTYAWKALGGGVSGVHAQVVFRGGCMTMCLWSQRKGFPDYAGVQSGVGATALLPQPAPVQNAVVAEARGLLSRSFGTDPGAPTLYWGFGGTIGVQ
jgi:hypothetical protein